MNNEREYRKENTIKIEDSPEAIETKIKKYYFRYYRVTDAEYNVALVLIKSMIGESIKSKDTKLVLKYISVWYKLRSLYNKRRRKGIMIDNSEQERNVPRK